MFYHYFYCKRVWSTNVLLSNCGPRALAVGNLKNALNGLDKSIIIIIIIIIVIIIIIIIIIISSFGNSQVLFRNTAGIFPGQLTSK